MSNNHVKHYSAAFKAQVVEDYFHSKLSASAHSRKWNVPLTTFLDWLPICTNGKKVVSLQPISNSMDAETQILLNLQSENERLKQEIEYQRLKIASYERLLEIVKKEDGIDLLKKDGAKQ